MEWRTREGGKEGPAPCVRSLARSMRPFSRPLHASLLLPTTNTARDRVRSRAQRPQLCAHRRRVLARERHPDRAAGLLPARDVLLDAVGVPPHSRLDLPRRRHARHPDSAPMRYAVAQWTTDAWPVQGRLTPKPPNVVFSSVQGAPTSSPTSPPDGDVRSIDVRSSLCLGAAV